MDLSDAYLEKDKKTILDIKSFSLNKGECVGVIGENGAGKSTLLRVLALIEPLQKGQFSLGGQTIKKPQQIRKKISLVFQEPLLFKGSVYENISYPLKIRKIKKAEIIKRCKEILDNFKIAHLSGRDTKFLSGGEARRVGLARALVYKPAILLLDEPFNDLDEKIRLKIEKILFDYLHKTNVATVFVSHDFRDIAKHCNKVVVLNKGKIVQEGSVSYVHENPKSRYVADIIGSSMYIEAEIESNKDGLAFVKAGESRFKVSTERQFKIGQKVLINLRPEDIFISINGSFKNTSIRNSFVTKIMGANKNNGLVRLKLKKDFLSEAVVTKQSVEELDLIEGKTIVAGFKATAAKLLDREND